MAGGRTIAGRRRIVHHRGRAGRGELFGVMTQLEALIIAVVQGATELFPVSSLGHAVILPALLGWNLDQHGRAFLPFLVLLHLGTAVALLAYFWRDWWELASRFLGIGQDWEVRQGRRIVWLIVVATIPVVVVGGGLEHLLRRAFGTPLLVSLFLAANGVVLLAGERLRARLGPGSGHKPIASLSAVDALVIGIWQCLALLPGLSRSGVTMVGALLRGVDHEASARFSFLIALPVILAATALEIPKLLAADVPAGVFRMASIAAVVSGVVAFASTALLMRWFRGHDGWALSPFALYCIVAGLGSAAFFLMG